MTAPAPRVAEIIKAVADESGIGIAAIYGPHRYPNYCLPRHRAMWLARTLRPDMSGPQLARAFHRKDHSTIIHGVRRYGDLILVDDAEREISAALLKRLKPKAPARIRLLLERLREAGGLMAAAFRVLMTGEAA